MIKLLYPKFWQKKNLLSYLLLPLSWLYRLAGLLRDVFAKNYKFPAFVVCVGNATVGGGGKTQIVAFLAQELQQLGYKVLLVTKAYGGNLRSAKIVSKNDDAVEVGDESILLAQYAQVLAAKSILAAAKIINSMPEIDVIIFDDGMQSPYFHKDYNILVCDAGRGVGNNMLLPAGPLRQKFSLAVKKADSVIVMGGLEGIIDQIFLQELQFSSKALFSAFMQAAQHQSAETDRYLAFCGIGNPERFYDLLQKSAFDVQETKSFPDHHYYSVDEIEDLKLNASKRGLKLVTTRKDYVKIADKSDILCFDVSLKIDESEKLLSEIDEKIASFKKITLPN
jgi:tetraacyldisaccharide 4'-kinase